jgi:hypothetical protein
MFWIAELRCSPKAFYSFFPDPNAATKGGSLARFYKRETPNSSAKRQTSTSMLLTVSEISTDQPTDSWFCLRAQPKRESR